ncbi:MAG: methylcobamide--CoM methyltransferase MtbA, partial [Candidatus Electrothrix sp. AUS4]|nr:methylcobamide--CoM methyltransferase MtbA [Candidatus Electrothrix sp. AUS4]
YSRAEYVVEGQLRMLKKYRHDFVNALCAAALSLEPFGGEVIWYEDGAPNSGEPFLKTEQDILSLRFRTCHAPPLLSGCCRQLRC